MAVAGLRNGGWLSVEPADTVQRSEPQAAHIDYGRLEHAALLPAGGMTRGAPVSTSSASKCGRDEPTRVSHVRCSRKISAGHGWCTAIRAAFWPSNTAQTSPVQVLARPQQKPRGLRGVRECRSRLSQGVGHSTAEESRDWAITVIPGRFTARKRPS